jgi:fibronectin-binding autotransporter adhesin
VNPTNLATSLAPSLFTANFCPRIIMNKPPISKKSLQTPASIQGLRITRCALLAGVFLASGVSSQAQNAQTWTGATAGTWGTGTNWSPNATPSSTSDLTIKGPANANGTLTINVAAAASADSINFTDTSAVTLSNTTSGANQTLTIGASSNNTGITTGSGAVTIGSSTANQNVNIALGSTQTWNIGSGGLTVANVISGSTYGITKTGSGTLNFNGANTYSGATTVNAGTLILGAGGSIASSNITATGSNLTVNNGSGTVTRGGNLTLNNGANFTDTGVASITTNDEFGSFNVGTGMSFINLNPASTGTATVTFSSMGTRAAGGVVEINGTFGGTVGANNTALIFTTAPSGTNFIGGGGALGTNTMSVIPWLVNYEGATVYGYDATKGVTAVSALSTSNLNTAGSTTNVSLSASPTLTGAATVNSLQLNSYSITMAGNTLTVSSGVITEGVNSTIGNDASSANWGTLAFGTAGGELTVSQARTLTINSVITGSGGLTFVGNYSSNGNAGALVLNGANTYTGLTSFYGIGKGSNVYLNNSLALQDTTLNYTNSNGGSGSTVNFGNGGTNGQTAYTFGGLEGNVGITLANGNTTVQGVNLTIGSAGDSDSTTYSGVLSGTTSGNGLTKAGSGTLTLTGANTYTGTTAINGGVLNLGIAQNGTTSGPLGAGASTQAITFAGGTLQYSAVNNTDYSARIMAGTSSGAVSIDTNGRAVTFGTALTSAQSGGLTESDTAGGGSLTLSVQSAYSGNTTVNSGSLIIGSSAGFTTGAGNVVVNSTGSLNVNASGALAINGALTLAGGTLNLQGAGALDTITASGALTLSGTNVYDIKLNNTVGNGVDELIFGAAASLAGTTTINLSNIGTVTSGNYTLISDSHGGINSANFALGTEPAAGFNHFSFTGSTSTVLNLDISANATPTTAYWTGAASTTGGDSNNNWAYGASLGTPKSNWSSTSNGLTDPLQVPGSTTTVYFTATNVTGSSALSTQLDANYSIAGLNFDTSGATGFSGTGVTINTNGNKLTIGSGALTVASTDNTTTTISGTGTVVVGSTAETFANNATSKLLTISAGIQAANNSTTLTIGGGGNTTLSGTIANGAGTLGLTDNSTGTLVLSGPNTYTLGTIINNGGTVQAGNATALGNAANSLALSNSSTFQTNGNAITVGSLSGDSTSTISNTSASTAGSITNNTSVTDTFAGTLADGTGGHSLALTMGGSGELILGNSGGTTTNTYSGATTLSSGTLQFNGAGAMSTTSAITQAAGTTVNLLSDTTATFNPSSYTINNSGSNTINVNELTGAGAGKTLSLANFTFNNANVTPTLNIGSTSGDTLAFSTAITLPANGSSAGGGSAATFNLNGANVTLNGITGGNDGGMIVTDTGATGNSLTVNSSVATNSDRTLFFTVNNGGTLILNNTVTTINNTHGGLGVNLGTSGGTNTGTLDVNNNGAIYGFGNANYFNIYGGTLDNTHGSAVTETGNNNTNIYGSFNFNGSNNLGLGIGAVTLNVTPTITTAGSGTLTLGRRC